MRRIIALMIIAGLVIQCGPPPSKDEAIHKQCAPGKLTAKPNDGSLFLKWETPCSENVVVSGYNIYFERESLNKYQNKKLPGHIKSFNSAPYPGDADPETSFETIEIGGLENGVEYFVSVRTVYSDGHISSASNEVPIICRPEGEFELAYRYKADNDGFSFSEGVTARADSDENDLYFYGKDGVNFLASPHRLNGFIRKSQFYSLGPTENIYQYPELELDFSPVDRIPINIGESYIVLTADGNYAKLRIEDITGENKERIVKIKYIYQTLKELMKF